MALLVLDQLALGREWQVSQLFERIDAFKIHAGIFAAVKFIRRQHRTQQLAQ
jgi:hypothetical protein